MAHILVVDDDQDTRTILTAALQCEGHEVVAAADGAQGAQLQRSSPADVIIMDIFMPEKDGIEAIRELRAEFPDTPIIAMSGGGRIRHDVGRFTAQALGARVVLRKPVEVANLVEIVNEALKVSNSKGER